MALEFHVLDWDRHKNVERLNRLMASQLSPFLIIGSPIGIQIQTSDKNLHRFASTQK